MSVLATVVSPMDVSLSLREAELALLRAAVDYADGTPRERFFRSDILRKAAIEYREAVRRITGSAPNETV
jgi:hypothetical protein